MKRLLLLVMTVMGLCAGSWAAARHQEVLTDGWQFSRDSVHWADVTVPHDWAISGPFDKKWDLQVVAIEQNGEKTATEHSGRSGALPWIGRGYYRRALTVPEGMRQAELVFDGAMADAHVYVNGHLAGRWAYGYNAFRVDVTPYLRAAGDNELVVALNNLEESSRWYPGGGLYRPVTLVATESACKLDEWGLFVNTISLNENEAFINVHHKVQVPLEYLNPEFDGIPYHLLITLRDQDDALMGVSRTSPDGTGAFHCRLTIKNPKPWTPETPHLYHIRTELVGADGRLLDVQQNRFGVRMVSVSREHGFQLNGVTRKIKGVCLHHDLGPLGAAVNRTALARQIMMMKSMGADAIRTSHNMPSTWQMELCDSLGMMVMAESFDAWAEHKGRNDYNRLWDEWWSQDVMNLILNHRNHPSIVMWSMGNEIPEQWKPEGAERYKQLIELCHELDPTRPVTCGIDNPDGALACGFAQVADVPSYNYRVHRYEDTFSKLPQGFLLGSETASTVSTRGHYVFPDTCATNKAWPDLQCSGYDTEYCWWSNLPDDDWRVQDDLPWTIGEFVWTGYDYLGEPTPYDNYWPSRSSYFGIVDLAGLPKDRYWLYRSHWNKKEHTIHLLPHWTWPGREGQVTPVYCYTDYPSAELFVNGKSQGRISKDATSRLDRYRLRWRDVEYEPGEIKVVVYDENDQVAGERIVRTAGKPKELALQAERGTLRADGEDLAFVTVSLVDERGTLCPDADDELTFDVAGKGVFRAVCNGDATSLEPFTQPRMRLFHGQLVVIVQAGKERGEIALTVRDKSRRMKTLMRLRVE